MNAFNTDVTIAAQEMQRQPDGYDLRVSPLFYSPVTNYIYPEITRARGIDLMRDVPVSTESEGVAFFLDYTKLPYVGWLNLLYPGAQLRQVDSPVKGSLPLVYEVIIPRDQVDALRGIDGTYERPGQQAVEVREPSLDLDWSTAPPLDPPFNARWTGVIKFANYQERQLTFVAPGHVRLTIDGQLVGEGDGSVQYRGFFFRGDHTIEGEATIERPGQVALKEFESTLAPTQYFAGEPLAAPHGLLAKLYDAPDFTGPPHLQQLDPFVGYHYHNELPSLGDFSMSWDGYIDIPADGAYAFWIEAVESGWMSIDGREVLAPGIPRVDLLLPAGRHPVQVRFSNKGGYPAVFWYWAPPGATEREVVPAARLSPR
jgi:hypothetical protein